MNKQKLRKRWLSLMKQSGIQTGVSDVYKDIVNHYSEQHRHYHNLVHIYDALLEFDESKQLAQNPLAVELAIWFHDIIYDTKASNNEERSADFTYETLDGLGFTKTVCELVSQMIVATKHDCKPSDSDTELLIDIDLSILGQPPKRFTSYEQEVRAEYVWVSDLDFKERRSVILNLFLARKKIYSTDLLHKKYERKARENIRWSIQRLTQ